MTTLHLIRHGQTNWNAERRCQGQSESELDSKGRGQAVSRRETIDSLNISAVYSSTSDRTRQTTDILTENLSQNLAGPVTYLDSLREIFLGPWETLLWDDIHANEPQAAEQFHTTPQDFTKPGTESYAQLRDRGVAALEHILSVESSGNILVVSHGALLKATMTHYAGVGLKHLNAIPALSNCSHSVLRAGPDEQRELISIDGIPLHETEWHNEQ